MINLGESIVMSEEFLDRLNNSIDKVIDGSVGTRNGKASINIPTKDAVRKNETKLLNKEEGTIEDAYST